MSTGLVARWSLAELDRPTDMYVTRVVDVEKALVFEGTRNGRPSERVELGKIKTQHVALFDADQLVQFQLDSLKSKLGRTKEILTNQRVGPIVVLSSGSSRRATGSGRTGSSRRAGCSTGSRSPDVDVEGVLNGYHFREIMPAPDDVIAESRL